MPIFGTGESLVKKHYWVEKVVKYQVMESYTRDDGAAGEGSVAEADHIEDANSIARALAACAGTTAKTLDPADISAA